MDVTKRKGFRKLMRRYYVVKWDDVTGIDVRQPENKQVGGSTINAHTVLLTVDTPTRQYAFTLRFTDETTVRNQLGEHAAKIRG